MTGPGLAVSPDVSVWVYRGSVHVCCQTRQSSNRREPAAVAQRAASWRAALSGISPLAHAAHGRRHAGVVSQKRAHLATIDDRVGTFEQHWKLENFSLLDLWRSADFYRRCPVFWYRMKMTHKQQAGAKRRYRNKKVILLVRHPRDIIVSWYFEVKKRNLNTPSIFLRFLNPIWQNHRIVQYFNEWAEQRSVPRGFLLVRYEDLQADTVGELRRIFDFLGYPGISNDELQAAAAYGSFDNMRQMERENTLTCAASCRVTYRTRNPTRRAKAKSAATSITCKTTKSLTSTAASTGVSDDTFGYASHTPRP